MGCKKDKNPGDDPEIPCEECEEGKIPLWDDANGTVWINDNPNVDIEHVDEYLEERETLIDPGKDQPSDPNEDFRSELWDDADDSIWINDNPNVDIDDTEEYPEEEQTLF